ncbi:hypothetical protein, partial [Mesorhizobium sp.]
MKAPKALPLAAASLAPVAAHAGAALRGISNRRHPPSPQAWAIAFALAAALSGCQSKGSVSEALDPAAIAA